jgi:hypothetical protein
VAEPPIDLVPAVEDAVADLLDPGVTRRIVPEQDVVGTGLKEVADTDRCIIGVGADDLAPAGGGAVGLTLSSPSLTIFPSRNNTPGESVLRTIRGELHIDSTDE